VVTLFTSPPDLSVVFFCLVLFSLVAAAFLANKDVYIDQKFQGAIVPAPSDACFLLTYLLIYHLLTITTFGLGNVWSW